jgi:hypothetical protein
MVLMKLLPSFPTTSAALLPLAALVALLGAASGMSVGSPASGSQGIVDSIVDSTSVTVQSHNLYGLADQWGLFFGGASAIGMDHGVVLSSSVTTGAVGAYMPDHVATGLSRVLPPNNNATYDAVTLRLAFTCSRPSTRVQFRYVFGSNEFAYDTSIGNDAMGAFLNGNAPASNIAKMCISTDPWGCAFRVPVTANNVFMSAVYVDNVHGNRDTYMMGFTTPLRATGPAKAGSNKIFITCSGLGVQRHRGSLSRAIRSSACRRSVIRYGCAYFRFSCITSTLPTVV